MIKLLRPWSLIYNQRLLLSFQTKKNKVSISNLEKLMKLFARLVSM